MNQFDSEIISTKIIVYSLVLIWMSIEKTNG